MPSTSSLPQTFVTNKRRILESLAVPSEAYDDLSPKGSIDEGIRDLIDEINQVSFAAKNMPNPEISRVLRQWELQNNIADSGVYVARRMRNNE
jgi:hypothetical protein